MKQRGATDSLVQEDHPRLIPVLAVRDHVHFPELVTTLHVAREASVKAAKFANESDRQVLVVSQRDMGLDEPTPADLYQIGTLSEILQSLPMPDASQRLALRGVARGRIVKIVRRKGAFFAEVEFLSTSPATGAPVEALRRECLAAFGSVVHIGKGIPPETVPALLTMEDAGSLADAIAHHLPVRPAVKQRVLEELEVEARLEKVLRILRGELDVLELQQNIQKRVQEDVGASQRDYYLREQLRIIQAELGQKDDRLAEREEYQSRIGSSGMSEAALAKAMAEYRRLESMPDAAPEGTVSRNYLDWLLSLPWRTWSEDRLEVHEAARLLEEAHHGLSPVKDRILDFLAVRQLNPSLKGPILCFVGPPGVGKTSIGRSIAEALGRRFVRISLGGVRDEAEIRGHRRTYVGAMPGRLIQGMRQCGTRNPVFMLDEIDKIAADNRGDATSALLEALDPEQNAHFSDHFIEAPFDLSEVMFIATANSIDTIPSALRDRMEVIQFPGYTDEDRIDIARRFLFPRRCVSNGLRLDQLEVTPEALQALAKGYTREAGVRNLERVVDTVCRKAARKVAEGHSERIVLGPEALIQLLGACRGRTSKHLLKDEVGTVNGLVVTEYGGEVITIEANLMEPNGPASELQLTGSLGDVMKESAQAAITYVRANQHRLAPGREFKFDVHVHVPEGAMPKDGPSAGVTIAVALASAFTGAPVRSDVAMTGEITLRGKVFPVGGLREKVLAAHRAGIRHLLLPLENEPELEEVPAAIREAITFHPIRDVQQALDLALVYPEKALVDLGLGQSLAL